MQIHVDPLDHLQQACAMCLQAIPTIKFVDCEPGEKVVAELLPEDAERFKEIGELFQSVRRMSDTLLRKSKRLQAQQTLFWDDVHTRYEDVRDMKHSAAMGVRKGDEEGTLVLVTARIDDHGNMIGD